MTRTAKITLTALAIAMTLPLAAARAETTQDSYTAASNPRGVTKVIRTQSQSHSSGPIRILSLMNGH